MAFGSALWLGLCRSSYFVSLLGLKIPLGLLLRASRARHVLFCIVFAWVPFLVFCHAVLVPMLQTASQGPTGINIWHVLTAIWITLPLLTVGTVIMTVARSTVPFLLFSFAFACVMLFHSFVIPAVAPTWMGSALLHAFLAFFEDAPAAAWIWCLFHVVLLQEHIRTRQSGRESPFAEPRGPEDKVLIVGNAPTVTDGPPLGAVMDGFNHVVRFNSYSVSKTDHTGTKVDFHFCNGRNFPTVKSVKAILPLFNSSLTHAVYLFMPHMAEAQEIYANLTSTKVDSWFVGEEEILLLRKKIGCRVWQIPTSGMVAINAFLLKRSQVFLHGFNFFEGKKIHYFEESPVQLITSWLERFVTHDPSLEKVWVSSLMRQGRAVFLNQQSTPSAGELNTDNEDDCIGSPVSDTKEKESKLEEEGVARRRTPGLVQALLKDGFPSQFSL